MTRSTTRRLTLLPALAAATLATAAAAADDIDKAFAAQERKAGAETRVDSSVDRAAAESRSGVAERATAREEARRREIAAMPPNPSGAPPAAARPAPPPRLNAFSCTVYCEGAGGLRVTSTLNLSADTLAGAAKAADGVADEHCRGVGLRATKLKLSASQCRSR